MRKASVIAALVVSTASAKAQNLPAEGTPIQARTDFGIVTGIVQRRAADSLWILDSTFQLRPLVRPEIREMSTYGIQWARGAKRGALVGGIIGAMGLGAAIWADTHMEGECICIPASFVVAPIAVGLPIVGAGVGLVFAPSGWSRPRRY